ERVKIKKAIEAEVDHYLIKPFNVDTLQSKIRDVLRDVQLDLEIKRALDSANAALLDLDWRDAATHFERARFLDPKNIDALLGLAKIELKQEPTKGFENAIKHIRKA